MDLKVFKQVEKVLEKETKEIREDIADILEKLVLGISLQMPHVRSLGTIATGLYEIRVKDRNGQFRLVYYILHENCIYLIHAFRKKTQKMNRHEKTVILHRIQEVRNEKN